MSHEPGLRRRPTTLLPRRRAQAGPLPAKRSGLRTAACFLACAVFFCAALCRAEDDLHPTFVAPAATLLLGAGQGHQPDSLFSLVQPYLERHGGRFLPVRHVPGRAGTYALRDVSLSSPHEGLVARCSFPSVLIQASRPHALFAREDLEFALVIAAVPAALWVPENSPLATLQDLVRQARQGEERVRIAGDGSGTELHMAARMFDRAAGVKTLYLPRLGTEEAARAARSGEAHAAWGYALGPQSLPGMRALAVAAEERSPALPQTPLFRELGIPLSMAQFVGVCVRAENNGEKPAAVALLERAAADPEFQEAARRAGFVPAPVAWERMDDFVLDMSRLVAGFLEEYVLFGP